ncbi:MAG: Calvin cycle protein CP12 [Thermostichales cyanobacterium HHBFW_bins_127]
MTVVELNELIHSELEAAHAICAEKGEGDPACRVAWEIVEELLAARAHREGELTPFMQFCQENPSALECRMFDV